MRKASLKARWASHSKIKLHRLLYRLVISWKLLSYWSPPNYSSRTCLLFGNENITIQSLWSPSKYIQTPYLIQWLKTALQPEVSTDTLPNWLGIKYCGNSTWGFWALFPDFAAGSLTPLRNQSFAFVTKDVSFLYLRQRLLKSAQFVCPRDAITKKTALNMFWGYRDLTCTRKIR